ncbi:MAG TPA: hypothetical protein VLI04_15910 [Nocardioidaceae bacterium]|nr:hypothetical protein [Nocardioidaceae bacterium]
MNHPPELDSFETTLLQELRTTVAQRQPAPTRRTTRRTLGASGAVVTAAVAAAFGWSVLQPSAAFAVDEASNGDVVVRIHELSDTEGLEKALADHGIQASVDYDAPGDLGDFGSADVEPLPGGEGPLTVGEPAAGDVCGFGDVVTSPPMTSTVVDDEFVITIPADSPLREPGRELTITSSGGVDEGFTGLAVSWTDGGVECGMAQASAGVVPAP